MQGVSRKRGTLQRLTELRYLLHLTILISTSTLYSFRLKSMNTFDRLSRASLADKSTMNSSPSSRLDRLLNSILSLLSDSGVLKDKVWIDLRRVDIPIDFPGRASWFPLRCQAANLIERIGSSLLESSVDRRAFRLVRSHMRYLSNGLVSSKR